MVTTKRLMLGLWVVLAFQSSASLAQAAQTSQSSPTQYAMESGSLVTCAQQDVRNSKQELEDLKALGKGVAFAKVFLRDAKQMDAARRAEQIFEGLLAQEALLKSVRKAAQNNLAVLLMEKKEYQKAQALLLESLRQEAWVAATLDNLNQLYAYEAQKTYKEVFEKTVLQTPKGQLLEMPKIDNTPYDQKLHKFQINSVTTKKRDESKTDALNP